MSSYNTRRLRTAILLGAILVVLGLSVSPVLAKDYKIGPEDVIEIKFWQETQLNTVVRVSQEGKITLDIIGQIDAAGKTTEELQDEIVRQMSRINKNISQCVVRVQAFNYNYVFVTGQVRQPGKRSFEQIPDLWSIINEAGGVAENGDLTQVAIVRADAGNAKPEIVNVAAIVASGSLDRLPEIHRGDYIDIPRLTAGLTSPNIAQSVEKKNYVYVLGAVGRPSAVNFEDNTDILQLLALAGGPMATADLKKVKVVSHDGNYAQTMQVDLERYARSGKPARYILRREDALIVPERSQGFFGGFNVATVTASIGVITSIALLIDNFTRPR